MRKVLRYVSTCESLPPYLSFHEQVALTKGQYKILQTTIITESTDSIALKHMNIVKFMQSNFIRCPCIQRSVLYFVKSENVAVAKNTKASPMKINGAIQNVFDCLRVVLPSEWETLDDNTYPYSEWEKLDDITYPYLKICSAMIQ